MNAWIQVMASKNRLRKTLSDRLKEAFSSGYVADFEHLFGSDFIEKIVDSVMLLAVYAANGGDRVPLHFTAIPPSNTPFRDIAMDKFVEIINSALNDDDLLEELGLSGVKADRNGLWGIVLLAEGIGE